MLTSSTTGATRAQRRYKLVLLGESGVGKSSLAQRLVRNEWSATLNSTVGASFFRYACPLDNNSNNSGNNASSSSSSSSSSLVLFDIWDTAGQERYRSLASMYYRGAAAAVVVYEITSRATYEQAKYWVHELRASSPETHIALVGNKTDLASSRQVSSEEAGAYAAAHGLLASEASAKEGSGVREVFAAVARRLVECDGGVAAVREGGGVLASSAAGAGVGGNTRTCCA